MRPANIKAGIFAVGVIDWNRRMFDSLIPLPDGTSYNSFLVQGSEKTALIDTVDPVVAGSLFKHLEQAGVNRIDYVIANHAEQDHSGSIPAVLEKFPEAKAVCSVKCKEFLQDLLHIPAERIMEVQDGQTLSLGNRTLKFLYTPWVHWPETMVTYLQEDKILFSCDFFSSHLATSDLYVVDEARVYEAAKRFFAEIMMPFRANIEKNLEKIKDLPMDLIVPSHGPIYDNPQFIVKLWRSWVFDEPRNKAIIAYVSMHGSVALMADHLAQSIARKGVEVRLYDLAVADIGKLAIDLVDSATIILGTPTVLAGPHPVAAHAVFLVNALRPRLKYAGIVGSYNWGGKTLETIKAMLSNLSNIELLEPILIKGMPREKDYINLEKMADAVVEKHRNLAKTLPLHVIC
ncbi:MAG TPA: FprA family A-type flavoprotein [Dehalococcoidales bacterium]|nr:FprA family A-type flavoprotein [Dehalococcoidales bacterium]